MIHQKRLISEFFHLVQIDSPSGSERKIANYLKTKLSDLGFLVQEDHAGGQVGSSTGNLIITIPGNCKGEKIFFCAHMDTVEPGRGIRPLLKDRIITSDGVTILGGDDKAAIAALIEALHVIKEEKLPHGDVEVIFTVWEESGLKGVKSLDTSLLKSTFGYVLDSDGDPGTIIIKAPAKNTVYATIKGLAAHAGQSLEKGLNAIQVASRAITKMNLGRVDDETTTNISIIRGGKAINIVPDNTYIQGEIRSLNQEKLVEQTKQMCDRLEEAALQAGAKIDIQVCKEYEPIYLEKDEQVVQLVLAAMNSIGLRPKLTSTSGGSDANVLNKYGFPCANLGIGMSRAHTTSEYIKKDHLGQIVALIIEIIKLACDEKNGGISFDSYQSR